MAAKGTALLVAVAIGVSLGLLDRGTTSSTSNPSANTPNSGATSTASTPSPASSTSTASTTSTNARPSSGSTTTATANSTVVVMSDSGTAPAPLSECPGRVVGQAAQNDLTLRVFYASQARGTNCVAATHRGPVTAPGFLRIEIRTDGYAGNQWPTYATRDGEPGASEVVGAYLIGTDGRCVSATATYFPTGAGDSSTSVSVAGVGCG